MLIELSAEAADLLVDAFMTPIYITGKSQATNPTTKEEINIACRLLFMTPYTRHH